MLTLKEGVKDPEVVYLQALLGLKPDGIFGKGTTAAVIEFQKSHGLTSDGVVGPNTWSSLQVAKPRTTVGDKELRAAAESLGCEVAAVKAIREVETASSAFLSNGWPAILFEAHIFYKQLGASTAENMKSKHPGIISKAWNKSLYKGGTKECDRLREAWLISPKSAAASISTGAFQLMGFNAPSGDPIEFLGRQWLGEKEQLEDFTKFIKANRSLHKALIAKDWRNVARYYNGSGQVDLYSGRLIKAYGKYKTA